MCKKLGGFFVWIALNSCLFGQVRVYVDVVGDLFHAGHVEFFKRAKQHGDYLIVGVHSDDVVAAYKRKPILSLEERVQVIKACKYVDEVIPYAPLGVTKEWIEKYQIDLVMHGDDYNCQEDDQYAVPIELGKFKMIPYTQGISTSEIIDRIVNRIQDGESLMKKVKTQ